MLSYRVDLGHVSHTNFRGALTRRSEATAALRFAPSWRHTANLRVAYGFDHYNTDVGIPTIEDPHHPGRWKLPPDARRDRRYGTKNDTIDYQRIELAGDYRLNITDATYLEARAAVTQHSGHGAGWRRLHAVVSADDVRGILDVDHAADRVPLFDRRKALQARARPASRGWHQAARGAGRARCFTRRRRLTATW